MVFKTGPEIEPVSLPGRGSNGSTGWTIGPTVVNRFWRVFIDIEKFSLSSS
jgi:hypothetical protein